MNSLKTTKKNVYRYFIQKKIFEHKKMSVSGDSEFSRDNVG